MNLVKRGHQGNKADLDQEVELVDREKKENR